MQVEIYFHAYIENSQGFFFCFSCMIIFFFLHAQHTFKENLKKDLSFLRGGGIKHIFEIYVIYKKIIRHNR